MNSAANCTTGFDEIALMNNPFGQIMQLGYIVHDVEASAREWAGRVGAGPFYVMDRISLDRYYYRGALTPLEMQVAFGYWGSIQVELIKPLNQAETLYTQALRTSAGKLNHCATVVSDIDSLIKPRNLQDRIVQSGAMPTGLKFVYLEEYLPGGLHLELIEAQESTLMAFAGMEKAHRTWNGKDPVRTATQLQQDLAALR